jgi:hypothetical protein
MTARPAGDLGIETGRWEFPSGDLRGRRMTSPPRVFPLLALLVVAGCGEGQVEWAGEVTDSAGVRIVSNPEMGLWGPGEGWSVTEELRIGQGDGDPEYIFGFIAGVDVSEAGDVYVLDQQARKVSVFSEEGIFLRSIGRPGDGPGELGRAPNMVAVGAGDTLVVADPPRGLHRYDPGGSHSSTRPFAEPAGSNQFRWRVNGDRVAMQVRKYYTFVDPGTLIGQALEDPIVVFSPDLRSQDTLAMVPVPASRRPPATPGECDGLAVYAEQVAWDLSPQGELHVASTLEYSVRTYQDGVLRRIVRRSFEPRGLPRGDQDLVRRAVENRFRQNGVAPEQARAMSGRMCFPDLLPPVAEVRAGPDGTLWVGGPVTPTLAFSEGDPELPGSVVPTAWGMVPGPDWDVFDGEGRFLGTVTLPYRFRPFVFRHEFIYGSWEDEIGVPHVLRLRILRPEAG